MKKRTPPREGMTVEGLIKTAAAALEQQMPEDTLQQARRFEMDGCMDPEEFSGRALGYELGIAYGRGKHPGSGLPVQAHKLVCQTLAIELRLRNQP